MSDLEQALELRQLAEKFSEGWHDGIKIDASDVMLLTEVANALEQQAEPVTWGVDWGEDEDCVSIVKRLPDGKYVVLAIERRPAKKQTEPTEGNPSY